MKVISIRERPTLAKEAIAFFQRHWANQNSLMVYEDCITSCLSSSAPLPQWYVLRHAKQIVGGAGLIPNDFISRMDLWPWLCALYIEEAHRGHAYGKLLVERVMQDAKRLGFANLYLCSDLVGYYEPYGFAKIAIGYHPWGESSGVFRAEL